MMLISILALTAILLPNVSMAQDAARPALTLPGAMPGMAPQPRPVNSPPMPVAFDYSKGHLIAAINDQLLWTQRTIVEATRGHVAASYFVRYMVQNFDGSGLRLAYEHIGTSWPQVGTILDNGTVLLAWESKIVWAVPGQPTRVEEVKIAGRRAEFLGVYPDGIIMRPTPLGVLDKWFSPIWWVPIRDLRLDFGSKVQLTDDTGIGASGSFAILRHENQIAWIDTTRMSEELEPSLRKPHRLCIYDLNTKKQNEIELPLGGKLSHFDGRYAFTGICLIDMKSGTVTKTKYLDAIAMHDGTAYTFTVNDRFLELVSVDLLKPEDRKVLLQLDPAKLPGFTMRPDLSENEQRALVMKANHQLAVSTEKGLKVWNGEKWMDIPWTSGGLQ